MNVVLKKFMIFDPSQGQDEGREGDKLLYHWTKDAGTDGKIDVNEQIDDICLCDASMGASTRLSTGLCEPEANEQHLFIESQNSSQLDPCDSIAGAVGRHLVLTLETTVIVMVEVEPNNSIWIAAHVTQVQPLEHQDPKFQANPSPLLDPELIPIDAIKKIIENIHTRFCLINGTFQMIREQLTGADKEPSSKKSRTTIIENMRHICDNYYNNVLPEIHLSSIISNVASLYNHVTYLNLSPLTLMKVTSFINHLVCIDPRQIRHTIAIFNDQLIWSSLNAHDTGLVYNYMVGVLIRDALQEELSRETEKVRRIQENMPIHLTGSYNALESGVSTVDVADVQTKALAKFYLTVFRSSNNMTLGLIFRDVDQHEMIQRCEQKLISDSRLGVVPLASLAKSVGQSFLKATLVNNTSPSQANQSGASTAISSKSRRRPSAGSLSLLKSSFPIDMKYICLDRLDLSVSSSFSMDAPTRDVVDGYNNETSTGSRKMRLIRYMIDLEPEMLAIQKVMGKRVEEYFIKTISDTWLTVMNSKYRCIYSAYKMRNAGLHEVQQAAINLGTALVSCRP